LLIVDAHLDLAYSALNYGRDPRRSVVEIRAAEEETRRGVATVAFPEMRKAGVGLVFATLFNTPATTPFEIFNEEAVYKTAEDAHRMGMVQLDYYHRLADEDKSLRLVTNLAALEELLDSHVTAASTSASDEAEEDDQPLIGLVPLMEGADPIREPEEAELWYERGVRLIGLAWDDTAYCAGAWRDSRQGLTRAGYQLLDVMADLGFVLDLTHMSEVATLEALDRYEGVVVATHSNARALVPGERQLSDKQIQRLGERDGVIGVVLFNAFLRSGYRKGDDKALVTLDQVVAHIDHICQVIGDAGHVGLGSDLDGGFGAADIPIPMDSIADLPFIADGLLAAGYATEDIANIMGGNWIRILRQALP
jgi:membrane dipeptidase